ncbi:Hypothetical predicted protein, partial [Mytilus galloprovincialis]
MTTLDNEQKGMTNFSNLSNDEQDVKDDDPASLNKTVIKDEADSHTLQSSDLQSSVATDDRAEVMRRNPVLFNSKLFPEWPTNETNSLSYLKNTKTQMMENVKRDKFRVEVLHLYSYETKCQYYTDLNNFGTILTVTESRMQNIFTRASWKKWGREKINTILDDEMKYDFKSVRALFVIIVSSGDQSGIYGTIGEKIQYDEITTKFEKVPDLMEKPKIFILDNYDIESDIPNQKQVLQDQIDGTGVPNQNVDIKMGKVPTEGIQYEVCTTDEHHPNRTNEGRNILVTNCCYETVPNQHVDTYTCIATTL